MCWKGNGTHSVIDFYWTDKTCRGLHMRPGGIQIPKAQCETNWFYGRQVEIGKMPDGLVEHLFGAGRLEEKCVASSDDLCVEIEIIHRFEQLVKVRLELEQPRVGLAHVHTPILIHLCIDFKIELGEVGRENLRVGLGVEDETLVELQATENHRRVVGQDLELAPDLQV